MKQPTQPFREKPFNLHERLLLYGRLTDLLDAKFDPLVRESDEIVRILGKIVHNALRRQAIEHVDAPHRARL